MNEQMLPVRIIQGVNIKKQKIKNFQKNFFNENFFLNSQKYFDVKYIIINIILY